MEMEITVLDNIDIKIREAIFDIKKLGYHDNLYISMPHYFQKLIEHRALNYISSAANLDHYRGCKYVPAYENQITIYHPFMLPQHPELCKIIKL